MLSFVFEKTGSFDAVLAAVGAADYTSLAQCQADALAADILPAAAAYLNEDKPFLYRRFKCGDLKALFLNNTQHFHTLQLQIPMIGPYGHVLASGSAKLWDNLMDPHKMPGFSFSSFGFLQAAKMDGGVRKQVVVPVITLEQRILNVYEATGQLQALHALQRCMGVINHDYYHQLTVPGVSPYRDEAVFNVKKVPGPVMSLFFFNTPLAERWEREHGDAENAYEYQVLHAHADVFAKMWADDVFKARFEGDVNAFIDGTLAAKGGPDFNKTMCAVMISHLLRVVDRAHPLVTHCAARMGQETNFAGKMSDLMKPYTHIHTSLDKRGLARDLYRETVMRAEVGFRMMW